MSDDKTCCAHTRVTCETTNYIDGSRMMRWTCDACGHDLIPQRLEATPDRYPIGDVVVLASDVERRWPMTVVRHENVATVEVFWLDGDGEPQSRYLPDAALRPYEVAELGFGSTPGSMAPSEWIKKEAKQ